MSFGEEMHVMAVVTLWLNLMEVLLFFEGVIGVVLSRG